LLSWESVINGYQDPADKHFISGARTEQEVFFSTRSCAMFLARESIGNPLPIGDSAHSGQLAGIRPLFALWRGNTR
jgi:hypothetical protein